jgi:hypothetical protein
MTKCLVIEGPGPSTGTCGICISAPTLPGPSGYQRALATPERHGWLNAIHDEVLGQKLAGCFHWARLPPGSKLLRNVLVLTTKLHPDFTIERLKARYCVDGSCEKPGEYADVCAHVAHLSTFKTQVASTAELEGEIYSGDWTLAYLRAVNTMPQYMREYSCMNNPKWDEWGNRLVLKIDRALYSLRR